jgi:hypothetical protein
MDIEDAFEEAALGCRRREQLPPAADTQEGNLLGKHFSWLVILSDRSPLCVQ